MSLMLRLAGSCVLLSATILAACTPAGGEADSHAPVGKGPQLGKVDGDGNDMADRDCKVILRSFARVPAGDGFEIANGSWVWLATIDVDAQLADSGAIVQALYTANDGDWHVFAGTRVPGAADAAGRVQYEARVDEDTVPTPLMDLRSWEYQRAELAIDVVSPGTDGGRLFDHNRVTTDLGNYQLTPSTNFVVAAAPAVCPATPPHAALDFRGDWSEAQHGSIVAGGNLTVSYDLSRLPHCRYSSGGAQLWDIEASIKFQPMGTLVTRSMTEIVMGTRLAQPLTIDVPLGTQYVDVWFHNVEAEQHCDEYDSNDGANYRFGANALPAPPSWAGNWGSSLARDCVARPGVPEPMIIDEYVRERACSFVEADVYAPGFTDGDDQRPELMWAQARYSIDGVAQAPINLESLGRSGNNWRYRWALPYELRMSSNAYTQATYVLAFSNDGVNWFQIGQGDGPTGGAARTIIRQ